MLLRLCCTWDPSHTLVKMHSRHLNKLPDYAEAARPGTRTSGNILMQLKTWKNWWKKMLAFLHLPTIKPIGHNPSPFLGRHVPISHPWKASQSEGREEIACCITSESIEQLGWVPSLHWNPSKDHNVFVYFVFLGNSSMILKARLPKIKSTFPFPLSLEDGHDPVTSFQPIKQYWSRSLHIRHGLKIRSEINLPLQAQHQ